jgi:hypothetical protein
MDVANYNACRGIYSPLVEHNNIACGFWLCGNDYHNVSKYYGAYPPSYLKRMKWLFPDHKVVMHLFSGKVETGIWDEEITVDVNPDVNARVVCDATHLKDSINWMRFQQPSLILADPPYDDNHVKYGTEKVNKHKVVKECAKVLPVGGYLVWLDTIIPIWAKADGWKLRGTIGMVQSTNHKCRVITILERVMIP